MQWSRLEHRGEPLAEEDTVGLGLGQLRRADGREGHVSSGQRWRVVETVPNHEDAATLRLQLIDECNFLDRGQAREPVSRAKRARNGRDCAAAVACTRGA